MQMKYKPVTKFTSSLFFEVMLSSNDWSSSEAENAATVVSMTGVFGLT